MRQAVPEVCVLFQTPNLNYFCRIKCGWSQVPVSESPSQRHRSDLLFRFLQDKIAPTNNQLLAIFNTLTSNMFLKNQRRRASQKKLRHLHLTTLQRRMSTFLLWFRNILLMTHYQNLCARPSLLLTCRMQKTIKDPGVLGKYLELF